MSLDSDYLVDRRRMRRKVTFWRVLAFLAVLLAVLGLAVALGGRDLFRAGQAQIARVKIDGVITGDQRTLDLLKRIRESNVVKAVLVEIDSPGGTVTGSEAVYSALREVAAKKPTVAVVDGLAASGGYIAAMGTDRIVARETSLVGSIGVLFQYPDVVGLLDKLGVKMEAIKSAPLKATPNPFEPTTPEQRAAVMSIIDSTYGWFKNLVTTRRGISGEQLAVVSDGRVWTGQQALPLKLIDEIGNEQTAIDWLAREKGLSKDLPVHEWKRQDVSGRFGLWSLAAAALRQGGLSEAAALVGGLERAQDAVRLDGLLTLWHPSLGKE
jgi:protease-4